MTLGIHVGMYVCVNEYTFYRQKKAKRGPDQGVLHICIAASQ